MVEVSSKHGPSFLFYTLFVGALGYLLFRGLPDLYGFCKELANRLAEQKIESDRKRDLFMVRMEENSTINTEVLVRLEKNLIKTSGHAAACVAQNVATEHLIAAQKAAIDDNHPRKKEVLDSYNKAIEELVRVRYHFQGDSR